MEDIQISENYFKKQFPNFTNISLQFTGIGHLVLHGNGILSYIIKHYNLNIHSLPLHTLEHAFWFYITNLKSAGFDVITIFFENDENVFVMVLIEFIKRIYSCKSITEINDYIKNERISLVLGDVSSSMNFLYKCAEKNLYVGFFDGIEIRIPYVFSFIYKPLDKKNEDFVFCDKNYYKMCEEENLDLKNEINKEIHKLNINYNLEKIENIYKNELNHSYFEKNHLDLPFSLVELIHKYLINVGKLNFDGRIILNKWSKIKDEDLELPIFFLRKNALLEYKPEKVELDYLVNFKKTNEKSSIFHLKNVQKSAQSLFNGKLLFAPVIKQSDIKLKKPSKKQQKIIEENEKRIQEQQKQKDNIWLRNFFIKYKNADIDIKRNLLEGVNKENKNIYKKVLLLKIEYYSDIWNLEKRSDNCDEKKIIPCYINCLEYIEMFLDNDKQTEFVLQKLIDCGFEATVHEIIEKKNLNLNLDFYTDDTSAPSDYDICFQLKHVGDKLKRNLGSGKDSRVLFEPDAWQKKLLDIVDAKKSAIVAAPTSSGKTFICFYAIESILRSSDTDMVIFCLPTKALANQVSSDIYARFALKTNVKTNIQGSLMKDFSNDPFNCQVLITIPSLLESILNNPPENILSKIKYIIIDEVHKISSEEMGSPIERIFHLSPCPLLVLSATLGNLNGFYKWMSQIENSKHRECELVVHTERYCELKPYVFSDKVVPINNLFAYSYEHIKKFGFGNDINFLPEELLELFDSLCAVLTEKQKELIYPLVPENFFKSNILTKKDCKEYEIHLLKYFENLIKKNDLNEKQVKKMYKLLTKESRQAFKNLTRYDDEYINENIHKVLDDLKSKNMLPAIVFNTDRDFINKLAVTVYNKLESQDIEIKKNKIIDKIKKEAKRNRDQEKTKDSWIEESLEAEKNFEYKTDKKNINFTYLDPVTKVTDYELEEETKFIRNTKPEFIDMLYRGIGVHHEQMNRKYRSITEILFRQKHLRVLFATDTLALGINMPCRTVIFAGDSLLLDPLNFKQMAGRAGRRGYDTLGNIVFMGIPQRRVQNLMVSMLPNIKGVYTYCNSSFVGFDLKESLIKFPLLESTWDQQNNKKNNSINLNDNLIESINKINLNDINYDLKDIFSSENKRRDLVNFQLDILNRFFNKRSYLNDLIISNRESDPEIFVLCILLENNAVNFEQYEFMNLLCHLFEVKPLLFNIPKQLPSLSMECYNLCKQINKLSISAINKFYNPVLKGLQQYSGVNLHAILSFIQVPYLDLPKNSYLLDFYKNTNVQKIVSENSIRSADLFKSLNVINTVLISLVKWYTKYEINEDILKKITTFYQGFEGKFRAIFA